MMNFHYGLGTHFNAWTEPTRLKEVGTRFTSGRIDAQGIGPDQTRQYMDDVVAAGMHPIVIFDSVQQQEELPDGAWVEYQNEVNIGLGRPQPIPVDVYRDGIMPRYEVAKRKGQVLMAGASANMEKRDINWHRDLNWAGLPEDIIAVTHHYVPRDQFHQAHRLNWRPSTWTREYEVEQFRKAIGLTRRWVITEFGYGSGPNSSLTPTEAAAQIRQEWLFWQSYDTCVGAWLYQIHDSPIDDHDFGLYYEDLTLKHEIFATVPLREVYRPHEEDVQMVADAVIYRECFIPLENKPGKFSAYVKPGDERVVAADPAGNLYANPATSIGHAFETFSLSKDGLVALFDETGGPFTIGIRVV
jgi:hypothetical protein